MLDMTQGTQMCAVQLGWQSGAASVGADRRCPVTHPSVIITFLLPGVGTGRAHTGCEQDSVALRGVVGTN